MFSSFIGGSLPSSGSLQNAGTEIISEVLGAIASLAGLYFAWLFFLKRPDFTEEIVRSRLVAFFSRFWFSGWGFDRLYDALIVRPFLWMTRINREDFIDLIYGGIGWYVELAHSLVVRTQSGNMRWYAAAIAFGAVLMIALVVFT